jgi:hypothetical protein
LIEMAGRGRLSVLPSASAYVDLVEIFGCPGRSAVVFQGHFLCNISSTKWVAGRDASSMRQSTMTTFPRLASSCFGPRWLQANE